MSGKAAKKKRKADAANDQLTRDISHLQQALGKLSPDELEVCYQTISVEVFRRGIAGDKLKADVISFKRSLNKMDDQLLISVTRIIELLRREHRVKATPPPKSVPRWWAFWRRA